MRFPSCPKAASLALIGLAAVIATEIAEFLNENSSNFQQWQSQLTAVHKPQRGAAMARDNDLVGPTSVRPTH